MQAAVQVCKDGLHLAEIGDGRRHQAQQVERHFLLRKGADTILLNALCDNVITTHQTGATSPANDGTADGKIVAPALRVPAVEECLKRELGLGVETVVAKGTVVRRQRQDNLSRASLESVLCLVSLDGSKHTEKVGKHNAVSQLRLAVDVVNLATVLWDGSEWDNVVKIPSKTLLVVVDVVDKSIDILLTALVERHNNELRATSAEAGVHALVVLCDLTRVARSCDDHLRATADETLQDLGTNGASASAGHKDVLVLEGNTSPCSLLQAVKVDAGQLLAILPAVLLLALQMQEGHCLNLALLDGTIYAAVAAGLLGVAVHLAVLCGHDLTLVHGERAHDVAV